MKAVAACGLQLTAIITYMIFFSILYRNEDTFTCGVWKFRMYFHGIKVVYWKKEEWKYALLTLYM